MLSNQNASNDPGRDLLRSCRTSFIVVGCFSLAINVLMLRNRQRRRAETRAKSAKS